MGAVTSGGGGGVFVEVGVDEGRIICGAGFGSFTKRAVGVVMMMEGWNGVGVAVESGAEVIRMIGRTTWFASAAGAAHADKMTTKERINTKRREDFMYG